MTLQSILGLIAMTLLSVLLLASVIKGGGGGG